MFFEEECHSCMIMLEEDLLKVILNEAAYSRLILQEKRCAKVLGVRTFNFSF